MLTTLATWNVNSLKVRLPRVLELLNQHQPDVLLMQETKSAADAFPFSQLAEAGYEAVDHSAGQWAGVAVAARAGLRLGEPTRGLTDEPDPAEARWIEVEVDGVRVISLYVPNGRAVGTEPFEAKLAFLDAARARLAALAGSPLIVAGDFNVAPADADVYDPAAFVGDTHVTAEERERLAALLSDGELVDAYRALHSGEPGFTWWDYRQGHFHRGLGMRIDLVLVDPATASRLESCGIDRNYRKGPKPSDHAPLLAALH